MTPADFYNKTIGNLYEMDGVPVGDPYQCADYFKKACVDLLGYNWPAGGDGYVDNWWYNRGEHADVLDFISPGHFQNGDFVIWPNASRGETPFPLSHIGMYYDGDLVGMNQNGHKEVTRISCSPEQWDMALGAFRFKNWSEINQGKMRGCDVSQHNDISIDLTGFDFVIIRAAWGTNLDTKADAWRRKCEALGIPYGVYLYSYALDTIGAQEEAEFILQAIQGWNVQLGVWIDMEDADGYKARHGVLNAQLCSDVCRIFCQAVQATGYYTGIYASQSWFGSYIKDCDMFDHWVASWGSNDGTIQRDTEHMGTLLQYTSAGGLDKDISYVTLDHYKSYPAGEQQETAETEVEPVPVGETPTETEIAPETPENEAQSIEEKQEDRPMENEKPVTVREQLAKLIDVKSIITIMTIGCLCFLAVKGNEIDERFLQIVTAIVTFYFGYQNGKKNGG